MNHVFEKNPNLFHLDLSYNNFNSKCCDIFSRGLANNHTLFGIHLVGNNCCLDALGHVVCGNSTRIHFNTHILTAVSTPTHTHTHTHTHTFQVQFQHTHTHTHTHFNYSFNNHISTHTVLTYTFQVQILKTHILTTNYQHTHSNTVSKHTFQPQFEHHSN